MGSDLLLRTCYSSQLSEKNSNRCLLITKDTFHCLYAFSLRCFGKQGIVVLSFVTLILSLRLQFVNYISTSKANTLLFLVEKKKMVQHCYFLLKKNVRILCNAKDSHIFSTKGISVFVILPFEILMNR